MPVPVRLGKHRHPPLFSGPDFVRYVARARGEPVARLPADALLLFGTRLRSYVLRHHRARKHPGYADFGYLSIRSRAGVVFGPIGAPNAAIRLEELRAHGVRRFVAVGSAGALSPELGTGAIILCTRAIRDEGTSHHYLPPSRYVRPSAGLTRRLRAALTASGTAFRAGPTWTTDAPYRETVPEIRQYRKEGVLTVEMEAATVFAVANRLGLAAAALFVVSDHLKESGWEPRFRDITGPMKTAFDVALRALTESRR